jgi:uroporphyrin-III C-methyltransferase
VNGKVYIVGAGPGSPELLTVKAAALLRVADVVLHDDLVPQEILDLIAPSVEVINVGKRCGRQGTSQQHINALMVQCARKHDSVVRLKSGDPAVFGRLGEELDALREGGISFEIVPGVTAATAAAAAARRTLTDRRTASALIFLSAHNCRGRSLSNVLFDPQQSTYVIYMPGPDYGDTGRELLRLGLHESTPCALVFNAGRAQQRVKFLSLSRLQSVTSVAAPALLVVGKVVDGGSLVDSEYLWEAIQGLQGRGAEPVLDF